MRVGYWLLEPDAGKPARPVLRGGTRREACPLPDLRRGFDSLHPLQNPPPPTSVPTMQPRLPGGVVRVVTSVGSLAMARGNGLLYLGVGAALMYLMDPQAGRKRRADLRNQLEAAGRRIEHGGQVVVRDASNRAIGAM